MCTELVDELDMVCCRGIVGGGRLREPLLLLAVELKRLNVELSELLPSPSGLSPSGVSKL